MIFFTFLLNGLTEKLIPNAPKRIAIIGLGSRANALIQECLNVRKNSLEVVAICDDNARESIDFFAHKLAQKNDSLDQVYKDCFGGAHIYPDTQQGLQDLFAQHKDLDWVFITSVNDRHLMHLNAVLEYSSCKHIYMEKPLFNNLDEFVGFNLPDKDIQILIGLTLRYASMTKIIVDQLHRNQPRLGKLKRVKAWERVRFLQALTSFMMSWRRYRSLSGGLLLEKSVHDLDLLLFFVKSLGVELDKMAVSTYAAHNFYKQSNKASIITQVYENPFLRKTLVGREFSQFKRFTQFAFDPQGKVDWQATIEDIFAAIPADNELEGSDIIPDYHCVTIDARQADRSSIKLELEVDLGGFRLETERGMKFIFESGWVEIDVMQSIMKITCDDGTIDTYDLKTNNSDHADGDAFIAQALLGILPSECYTATFTDPIVQRANHIAFISERQASELKSQDREWNRSFKIGDAWQDKQAAHDAGVPFLHADHIHQI